MKKLMMVVGFMLVGSISNAASVYCGVVGESVKGSQTYDKSLFTKQFPDNIKLETSIMIDKDGNASEQGVLNDNKAPWLAVGNKIISLKFNPENQNVQIFTAVVGKGQHSEVKINNVSGVYGFISASKPLSILGNDLSVFCSLL